MNLIDFTVTKILNEESGVLHKLYNVSGNRLKEIKNKGDEVTFNFLMSQGIKQTYKYNDMGGDGVTTRVFNLTAGEKPYYVGYKGVHQVLQWGEVMKAFTTLLKSEIKKAESLANRTLGVNNCKVTGYYAKKAEDIGAGEWYQVRCEICCNSKRADIDVILHVPMFDRRKTWAQDV